TFNCGPILAEISVTTLPPLQPLKPFLLGLSFNNPEPGISNHAKLVMARYDPIGGSCVSQPTKIDVPGLMARAEINHLSIFQLRQLAGVTDLANARVFPNPIYTRNQGFFTFDQLPPPTWVRIYTLHGERVARFISNSAGVAIWKFENESHRPVASGVYIAVLEHDGEKKIMKLVVIR
ncbi:MAG: T9SS type A sorting domain-containing protein, partial [Elusimicrobiota bacterium]